MHDELYPEIDEFANHDVDEEGIAKSAVTLHKIIASYLFKNISDI